MLYGGTKKEALPFRPWWKQQVPRPVSIMMKKAKTYH